MKIYILSLAALCAAFMFTACGGSDKEVTIVASETRTCYGVGMQQCMLVRNVDSQPWQFFYGGIEGFDYEPGYEYVLKVKKEDVANPPQDASSIRYTLVRVMSKEQRVSDDLPPDVGGREERRETE